MISLIRSFSEGDQTRFQSVALQLAADAARRGNRALAEEIRQLIQEARQGQKSFEAVGQPIPVVRPKGELAGIISARFPLTRLDDMVLSSNVASQLRRIVDEQRNRQKLLEHGLRPRRKFLLIGPPGTGKTMTASAIAGELSLPLFTILLDGVITKFMGETAAKLRLVFDSMENTRGVYFFDEFDALASSRLLLNDVGEARRMLNSMLQFLDDDKSDSLIIAATNHKDLLDRAVFRRFDSSIEYSTLPKEFVREVFKKALFSFDMGKVDWEVIDRQGEGLSQAEIVRSAENAARTSVLDNDAVITTEILLDAILDCKSFRIEDIPL